MKTLHRTSFLHRMLVWLSVLLLTSFGALTALTQIETRRILRQNALDTGVRNVRTSSAFLEIQMEQLSQLFRNIYHRADIYNVLQEEKLSAVDSYRIYIYLRSLLFMPGHTKIYQIYMDLNSSGQSYILRDQNSSYGPSRYHIQIPQDLEPGEVYGEGPHLASAYGYSLYSGSPLVYSFHWNIYNTAREMILGTISFDVEVSALKDLVFSGETDTDSIHYLLDNEGGTIYTDGTPLSQQESRAIISECVNEGWTRHDSAGSNRDLTGTILYSSAGLDTLHLSILRVVPDRILFKDANFFLKKNLLLSGTAMLFCLLLSTLLIRQFLIPIDCLSRYAAAVRKEGISLKVSDYVRYDRRDEVGELIDYIDEMMRNINDLFAKREQLSMAQRTAETRLLLAQINPHFLYNALQSVATLALQNGDREAYRYITMLGSRMQYSMNLDQTTVELRQEFRYVESYLALQNVRFGYCLQSEIRLSPEAESVIVPKMILQPLAENAFKHGKLCRAEGAFFRLTGEVRQAEPSFDGCCGSLMEIIMENNGRSLSVREMERLNSELSQIITADAGETAPGAEGLPRASEEDANGVISGGIGLKNVIYRLRLYHGDRASLTLEQVEPEGVRIRVKLPL